MGDSGLEQQSWPLRPTGPLVTRDGDPKLLWIDAVFLCPRGVTGNASEGSLDSLGGNSPKSPQWD